MEIDTGVIQFEFFDNGELGAFADAGGASFGTGLQFMGSESGLYEGTFLVGQSFTQVSGDAYEWPDNEWVNVVPTSAITPPSGFDDAYETVFNDSAAAGDGPLGLQVRSQAYAADGEAYVVLDYYIENVSGGNLNGLYAGLFVDYDVSSLNYLQNLCGLDAATQLLYCWDPTNDNPNYFGHMALDLPGDDVTVSGVSYDALPGDAILFGGLSIIQTPPATGADRRTVLGVGPFNIGAGQIKRVAFAFVAGPDLAAVIDAAEAAQEAILTPGTPIEPGPDGTPGTHALSAPAPNPFTARTSLSLEVATSQNVRVSVYDALGREVAVLHDGTLPAGAVHALELNAASLPSGVYMIRVHGEQFSATRQITLTR